MSSVLDKDPFGLKVLAKKVLANKFKCKESLLTAVETRIWEVHLSAALFPLVEVS